MKIPKLKSASSIADEIINLISELVSIYKDKNREAYLIIDKNGIVIYLYEIERIDLLLRKVFIWHFKRTVKSADIKTAREALIALAEDCTDIKPVAVRIHKDCDTLYYDLWDGHNTIVQVSPNHKRRTILQQSSNFCFRRDGTMQAQVIPNFKANISDFLKIITEFVNVVESQLILVAVYLCAAFIPDINHPILIVEGEKGAGKSSALRFFSKLINPVTKDLLVLPKDTTSLVTVLSNNYYVAFDNVGNISDEICNVLCQSVTGGCLSKRKLYSDNTEISLNLRRLVALNGISMHIRQTDLLDRTIMVYLKRISPDKRATEEDIEKSFSEKLPDILGCVFQILAKALEVYKSVNLQDLPRMADYAKYGYCIAEAIKKGYGEEFLKQYTENQRFATESTVGDNPVLDCVRHIVEKHGYWKGSMTELLHKMRTILTENYISGAIPKGFPQNASSLSRKLKSLEPDLQILQIKINIGRDSERYVELGDPGNAILDGNDGIDDDFYNF